MPELLTQQKAVVAAPESAVGEFGAGLLRIVINVAVVQQVVLFFVVEAHLVVLEAAGGQGQFMATVAALAVGLPSSTPNTVFPVF